MCKSTKIIKCLTYWLKQGTKEYTDFWQFLAKYQNFEKTKGSKQGKRSKHGGASDDVSQELGWWLKK